LPGLSRVVEGVIYSTRFRKIVHCEKFIFMTTEAVISPIEAKIEKFSTSVSECPAPKVVAENGRSFDARRMKPGF
jgi:hypothetical protein